MSILMRLESPALVTRADGSTKTYNAGIVQMEEGDVAIYLNQQIEARSSERNIQPSKPAAIEAKPVSAETKQEKK